MTTRPSLESLLRPEYLVSALASSSAPDLRGHIAECEWAEGQLSYYRRVLHATLDIIADELRRREGGDVEGTLVERLTSVLADRTASSRGGHVPHTPPTPGGLDHPVVAVIARAPLAHLPEMTLAELSGVVDELAAVEEDVSSTRRRVHEIIDGLKRELVSRYRDGRASAAEVLPHVAGEVD